MLEDQVAYLLQRYLGNYVRGFNKEALKISVWRGDVELTNMQLKPEALNALELPVKVKAGFLGSVKLKVPWSRLGQEPVLVYLDQILILAEPATDVEGCSEDAIQDAKKMRVQELELKLLESQQRVKAEMNSSWLGSLINTIIGNLKLSISNVHIRYEDSESNPGHPFAAGIILKKLSAVTVDNVGNETFATGGALDHIQKSVKLESLGMYFDSDILPWRIEKSWNDLLPAEWIQIFEVDKADGEPNISTSKHIYILQPVSGSARYTKLQVDESENTGQPIQKAVVNLEDVTICLPKDAYRDIVRLADNFNSFNQRLRYAHYRPTVPVKADSRSWWRYAYKVVVDEMKKASGKFSWEQVLKYAKLRKKYVTLYASLLKADVNQVAVDNNEDLEKLDRELDIEVILQWRMLARKFLEQSAESGSSVNRQQSRRSWWSFGWGGPSKDENEPGGFSDDDWDRLNRIIGYKEDDEQLMTQRVRGDMLLSLFEIHMEHNASKLITSDQKCLADLSCDGIYFSIKIYPETKTIDLKLSSYRLMSPNGPLAESATVSDSFVGVFIYKPFDALLDWSLVAKASPCYMTYLKETIDEIISFFQSSTAISQTLALETANAVQMTIDGVKRTAQQQVSQALKDHARFSLDLDIAAPKITIPTKFSPDGINETKLLLDFGNLMLSTQEYWEIDSDDVKDQYLQFNIVLSDVSAVLVDGDHSWNQKTHSPYRSDRSNYNYYLPVIDKCMVALKVQQIESESPALPSMRISLRFPSLVFYFSPARYHRLMRVVKIFDDENDIGGQTIFPWSNADFEGLVSVLSWKGMGNREAIWQHRYLYLVGPSLYFLETPTSKTYKQYFSLRGKQVFLVPEEFTGNMGNLLAVSDATHSSSKVVEDLNALILRFDSDDSCKTWQNRFQGAIYRASGPAALSSLSEISSSGDGRAVSRATSYSKTNAEVLFLTGVLDELKIGFSCSYQDNKRHETILLSKESSLFEFRANGGQVELLMKDSNLYIGTLLKSLEIEDQFLHDYHSKIRYLARSFINSMDDIWETTNSSDIRNPKFRNTRVPSFDTEEQFFEASESLGDLSDSSPQYPEGSSVHCGADGHALSIKPPSFSRIPGLLPDGKLHMESKDLECNTRLDSFVKAQVIFYQQDSPLYSDIDKQVSVTLATLSFFCHRPTILAILEFVNAINSEEDIHDEKQKDFVDSSSTEIVEEAVIKGLLGKGKSRVVFYVTLNMARAQIYLVDETGCYLATLSQNNLLANIKVFPASFSIKAALGNLKISDDSLPRDHSYFWVCDMRNPGGSSFVELDFTSFSAEDDDYFGYDYSLTGQLSEVRIVYLNRFVQEVVSYFMGLLPSSSTSVVKLKDQSSDSEKWFTTNEFEGSPALKLDLSFTRPIIIMPRQTNSLDYLELDVLHITVNNDFHWIGGNKTDMSAVHLETMMIQIKEINLTVGTGNVPGENIIEDVQGLSIILRRSLRDLLHQIPLLETVVEVEKLTAAVSNREYQVITECAISNISETPRTIPVLDLVLHTSSEKDVPESSSISEELGSQQREEYVSMKVSVIINLVQLQLYMGLSRDTPLATVQAVGAWLLYKSSSSNESSIWATLKSFNVIDDRAGTKEEFRHAIGQHHSRGVFPFISGQHWIYTSEKNPQAEHDIGIVSTMLILDVKLKRTATSILLCVQRPHLLVALDFLLATTEFFVPTVRSLLSDEDGDDPLNIQGAIVLDKPVYMQPDTLLSLSPRRPLIADDERFDHYVYDGQGGTLYLESDSYETVIFVGNGKKLQFKNVTIKKGECLDSCIFLGSNSSYSALKDDNVFLVSDIEHPDSEHERIDTKMSPVNVAAGSGQMEYLIELQAIGPEFTFYNASKDLGDSMLLSSKLLHAELDVLCRLVMKGDNTEITGEILGFTVESNGIRVLEPFDTSIKLSNVSGRTNINLFVSDVLMNFSYSMLKLFLAIEEDILSFLRMTTKKVSVMCSQFDKVGTIKNGARGPVCAFWRAQAPPGFAVLGDCLTPLNKPPSRGVLAVNTSFIRVKRPVSYRLIWPALARFASSDRQDTNVKEGPSKNASDTKGSSIDQIYSIWFPVAPQGYVAVGCIVSKGENEPPLSSSLCISASLVSPCSLRDCIALRLIEQYSVNLAFWRVDNSFGTFLPTDISTTVLSGKAYELRQVLLESSGYVKEPRRSNYQGNSSVGGSSQQSPQSALVSSSRLFEAVASFKLIWWNQGSPSQQKLSIWRPVVPHGMFFFGDIAVSGYEPPNACFVIRDTGDDTLVKAPYDFQLVGRIRRQKNNESISFWLPQAPPGYVSLGCVASKDLPKLDEFSTLRCIRSDMVTGDQFPEESIWHTSDAKISKELFSIWSIGNEVGTFIVRRGRRKPPRRFALKLADISASSGSDNIAIDAEMKSFSVALYDDYGGLMVPLFNISLDGIGFSLHGRPDYMNSTVNFSLTGRSYNDKYDAWEPLIEPMDGFLRYHYDSGSPGTISQMRISTKDLNINVSASNTNLLLQAYSSWNSLSGADESSKSIEVVAPSYIGKSAIDARHRRNYFIIPQNRLGRDIFIRTTALQRYSNVIKMSSGDNKPIKVPVSKNMLDSHLNGDLARIKLSRSMVTIIIINAELPASGGLSNSQYTAAVHLHPNQVSQPKQQQSARTCGADADCSLGSSARIVDWKEMFFFKVDSPECYNMELMVMDIGTGQPVGLYSAPLSEIASKFHPGLPSNIEDELSWRELSSAKLPMFQEDREVEACGRIRFGVFLPSYSHYENEKENLKSSTKSGFIQISPSREGPWTSVRLNYAAAAACWRLGNDVVASELSLRNGSRYVIIRSLVCVANNTDSVIELSLKSTDNPVSANNSSEHTQEDIDSGIYETDVVFEVEKSFPSVGWASVSTSTPSPANASQLSSHGEFQGVPKLDLQLGWEWIDDWHIDNSSVTDVDGWVYAPDLEHLRWPESFVDKITVNNARQRRWIRHRRYSLSKQNNQMTLGLLNPGDKLPLPLQALVHPVSSYFLQLRPVVVNNSSEYSWSTVKLEKRKGEIFHNEGTSELHVSALMESEILLCCSEINEGSSCRTHGLWFSLIVQATEIGKDIHLDPIQDWEIIVNSPLSITNYLPLPAAYTVFSKPSNTQDSIQVKGSFKPGENIKVYGVDFLNPLYISLDLQGWDAMQEPICFSHPRKLSSKTATIKNSASGRVIQIIFEQNEDDSIARLIRVYVPYWISSARCPPMIYRVLDMSATKEKTWSSVSLEANKSTLRILWQVSDKEMHDGYTIASAISFKHFGLSLSLDGSEKESFGPVRTLSSLGDMDGSFDMYAYDADGNCFRAFISSKPCPYPAVPSKVITIRPYMTFTNRIGQEIQLKFGADPQRKVLHASDIRVPFICQELEASNKLRFQLQNTDWSCPIEINREDNFTVMLRKHSDSGFRSFVKVEIRGYEEESRFLVVFRPGSSNGPFRIENRISGKTICIRQTGLDDEAWIQLQPFSTTNFAWEDPYGQRLVDIRILDDISRIIQSVNIESGVDCYSKLKEEGICLHTYEVGDIKIARLTGIPRTSELCLNESLEPFAHKYRVSSSKMDESSGNSAPMELVVEIGTLGVSLVDHKPRELLFLHLERVFIAYSTGYDAGFTSRFKLVVGQLQLDNQLPLTVMPVLLAPESMEDASHPVFKTTITVRNENKDGTQVYPYVYVRVTDRCWRLNIHEPIIWDLVSLFQNLHLDRLSGHSDVMAVDPEIRINLIDVSEIKLKISVETAPTQRPHGVLGIWSPILSAIGNALKIQVHLRKVMHENRFMRKSAVVPSIVNRIRRDLIHDPLHLIFSVDVLGMTKSTFASLSKGFAELSTDGQFLQLRSKQVWSRRITGIGDGILQGTEALAQGVAFGVSGVVKKPIESARQYGILGLAQGLGRAFLGFIVQPVSGALDFVSLTVDGISASFTRCLDILSNKATAQRIRNPRAIHANGVLTEYCEREALGQMILYLAEASRHLGCTDLFKEPSKYAWSDFYEGHFNIPYHRIVLVTSKRVMLLQCLNPDKMDKRPCKIIWDVAWEDLLALELAKAGYSKPSHIIVHLKHFKKTQCFVRVVKCSVEEGESNEPQAVRISAFVRKIWKARLLDMKTLTLKVPSSQRHVQFAWDEQEERDSRRRIKPVFKPRDIISTHSDDKRFIRHVVNFQKIWSSELESRRHCTLCPKQVRDESAICSIWRPSCPDGYISVGDIARIGMHPPNVAAVYHYSDGIFAPPLGYDLVWRNCFEDYLSPVSIWHPRAPEGFVAMGCVAVAGYEEPNPDFACCVIARIAEETSFENEAVWTAPDAYPWSCYFYQVQSEALQFDALRQEKERSDCKPLRISEQQSQDLSIHTVESTKCYGQT